MLKSNWTAPLERLAGETVVSPPIGRDGSMQRLAVVSRREDSSFSDAPPLSGDDRLASPLLAGFDIAYSDLFAVR